jgi:hypothetical protein
MAITDRKVQIYLPEEQYRGVRLLAQGRRITFAHVVREALGEYLRQNRERWENDPISGHIGFFEGKDGDLSTRHDHYIYDDNP